MNHMLRSLNNPVENESFVISDAVADSDTIPKQAFAGGSIGLPVNTSITLLTLYTSHDGGSTWGKCQQNGEDVRITVAGDADEPVFPALPDAAYKYPMIRLVSDSSTNETATVWLTS